MKKLLLAIACVVAMHGMASALVSDTIGHRTGANDDFSGGAVNSGTWHVKDTLNIVYTAHSNDSVSALGVWTEGVTVIEIGLYRWNQTADTPTTRYYLDTLTRSSGSSWDSLILSPKVHLEPDSSYCVAISDLTCSTCQIKIQGSVTNGAGVDTGATKVGLHTDTSPHTEDKTYTGLPEMYATVTQYSAAAPDTCSVTHNSVTAIDTTSSTIVVRDAYTDGASSHDRIKLIWDDDSNPALPIDSVVVTSSITNPDTLTATGLTNCTTYYLWFIVTPHGCAPDTASVITVTTDCISSHRLIIGS